MSKRQTEAPACLSRFVHPDSSNVLDILIQSFICSVCYRYCPLCRTNTYSTPLESCFKDAFWCVLNCLDNLQIISDLRHNLVHFCKHFNPYKGQQKHTSGQVRQKTSPDLDIDTRVSSWNWKGDTNCSTTKMIITPNLTSFLRDAQRLQVSTGVVIGEDLPSVGHKASVVSSCVHQNCRILKISSHSAPKRDLI